MHVMYTLGVSMLCPRNCLILATPLNSAHQKYHCWRSRTYHPLLIVRKSCQNGLLLKHTYMYCHVRNYVRGHTDDLPTPLYLLSSLYVTHASMTVHVVMLTHHHLCVSSVHILNKK